MIPLYLLAGGKSSRFGSDKARAKVKGSPLIVRIVEALAPVAAPPTVVADVPDKYADLGLRTIADIQPGLGPMGGLATALHDAGDREILVTSCDLVSVEPAWVRLLTAVDGAAVAFKKQKGWQPLFAVYRPDSAAVVARHIASESLSLQLVLDEIGQAVPLPLAWVGGANTPDELADRAD